MLEKIKMVEREVQTMNMPNMANGDQRGSGLSGIVKALSDGIKVVDNLKQAVEPGIDKLLVFSAGNIYAINLSNELTEKLDLHGSPRDYAMIATGATLAVANYVTFKHPKTSKIRSAVGKVNDFIDGFRPASWLKSLTLAGMIYVGAMGLPASGLIENGDGVASVQAKNTLIDYENAKVKHILEHGKVSEESLSAIEDICVRNDMHCMGLLSVIDYETGGTFSPSKRNPVSSGTGLIQFMGYTAKELGTTTEKLAKMTQLEQLEYVEKYFVKKKTADGLYQEPTDIAAVVFYPKCAGKPKTCVVAKKGSHTYKVNPVDLDKDGKLEIGEYVSKALDRGYLSGA